VVPCVAQATYDVNERARRRRPTWDAADTDVRVNANY